MLYADEKVMLASLCRSNGTYAVLQAILEINTEACKSTYCDNPGAVIHQDTETLKQAVQMMAMNHPLRG